MLSMPARRAFLMPSVASAWGGGRRPPGGAGTDARAELVLGELNCLRIFERHRGQATGGHELDTVGARAQLLADRLAHFVWAVALAAGAPAVSTRHGDGLSRGQDSGTEYPACVDRVAQPEGDPVAGTEVADARNACLEFALHVIRRN
jgi:hypothetical protein